MTLIFGIIMFICLVPAMILGLVMMYPTDISKRKTVLGVINREEYLKEENRSEVDAICRRFRTAALKIVICSIAAAVVLLFLKDLKMITTVWVALIFVSFFGLLVPYVMGNREMKEFKKRIGITGGQSIKYADLKTAGVIRVFSLKRALPPMTLAALLVVFALLIDLKVIKIGNEYVPGSFLETMISSAMLFTCFILLVAGKIYDGMKNEVISGSSTVNANFNRAKKKNAADMVVFLLWATSLFTVSFMLAAIRYTDLIIIIALTVYMIILMVGISLIAFRGKKIEEAYAGERGVVEDDDDCWIGGLIYYNKNDRKLNVRSRTGLNSTINLGHPAGKVIGFLLGLSIIAALLVAVWLGMLEALPLRVSFDGEKLVCHQIIDDYVIDADDIESIELGDNTSELRFVRIVGTGMPRLMKGNYSVNGENHCGVFLNPEVGRYIKIVTKDRTYYICASTAGETERLYDEISAATGGK